MIDFGRELYVPWQLTRGAVLYRDIASLFGPLSPYVNALWMRLFGVSLMTLALCNMAIFAALAAGIHYLIRVSTDRATASAASLITLLLFGFSQYVPVGNYNFVTPYAHEATHGLALAVALIICLYLGVASGGTRWLAAAGLAFGLVNLTKPEIVTASVAAVFAGITVAGVARLRDGRWLARGLLVFAASATVAPLAFFLHFLRYMPAAEAARAVAGAWAALNPAIAANPFYLSGSGLDAPASNAMRMLLTFGGFVLFVAAGIWAAASRRRRPIVIAVGVLALSRGTFPRALPLMALGTMVVAWLLMRARPSRRETAQRLLPLAMWSAFGLVLLAKIALNSRIVHYGFYLALPATTVSVALVCGLIPEWLEVRGFSARSAGFRQIAFWAVAASVAPYLGLSHGWYALKTVPVASGADRFFAAGGPGRWQGRALDEARAILDREAAPDARIAVLPEGIMLNYLLRRASPLPLTNAMPPEIAAFGEERLLAALAGSPPDFVVLVQRDTAEYGVPPFGSDPAYGGRILALIKARYQPVHAIENGAIEIYGRR